MAQLSHWKPSLSKGIRTWPNEAKVEADSDDRDADQHRYGQDRESPEEVDQLALVRRRRRRRDQQRVVVHLISTISVGQESYC